MVSRNLSLALLAGINILFCCSFLVGCVRLSPGSSESEEVGGCIKIPPNIRISKPAECCEILEKYHYLMGESAFTEFHKATSEIRK